MRDFTEWTRKDFGDPYGIPAGRAAAETETKQDVQKPIQQLLCDIHEQASMPGITADAQQRYVTVRMGSMMARVALEHERVGKRLVCLTWVLVFLTVVLAALTVALLWADIFRHG